ncbi:MAG TPA: DUF262 domain-containing HNH endonuclease family protein [Spirochaetia bacterium]|nr:DUF262 domain-containing HNH endonuclease family protein [Spirochaetia bacterium]
MEAKERPLSFLKGQKVYKIPFFQRGYVWDEDNWQDLWTELVSNKKDCFLGSIILKADNTYSRDDITYKIVIDGQQRITTLTILLRALNDHLSGDNNTSDDVNEICVDDDFEEFLFYVKTERSAEGKKKIRSQKLISSKIDSESYSDVINGKCRNTWESISLDNTDENDADCKILRCYATFRNCLKKATSDEINRIIAKLTYDTSNILVVIELTTSENEQAIFDTINSAGVKLTNADIIKNALYQSIVYSIDGNVEQDIIDFYNKTWGEHFEKDEETLNRWLAEKVIGRITRTNIDRFLHCFAIIKGIYDPQENRIDDLSDCYKRYLSNKGKEEIKSFISELCGYADTYKDNFMSFEPGTAFGFDDQKLRLFQILDAMQVTTFDAYILNALKHYSEEQQLEQFNKLERYVMRNYISGNSSKIKNYNKDSVLMLQGKFDFDDRLSEEDQNDAIIEKSLKKMTNAKAKLVLFWIELYRHRVPDSDLTSVKLNYRFELEHIMPQKWEEYWNVSVLPVYKEDGTVITDVDEAKKIRAGKVYEIGNMTLLTSTLNKTLRNYAFSDKVNGKAIAGKFQDGMKKYGNISITTDVTTLPGWNEGTISARTKLLTKEVLEIWPNEKRKIVDTE